MPCPITEASASSGVRQKAGPAAPGLDRRHCADGGHSHDDDRAGSANDQEMPQVHSMTSSAPASSVCGTVKPSTLAVFMLMTSSNRVGCSTGRSAGLAPL